MKYYIIILFFISITTKPLNIITLDLELNINNFYIIKNSDTNLNFSFNNQTKINLMPKKYNNLIKMVLTNNKIIYNCKTYNIFIDNKIYETFLCQKNPVYNMNKIKLNINCEKYNLSIKETELFYKKGKYYYFNFWTNNNVTDLIVSDILSEESLNNDNYNNIYLRKLEGFENVNDNNTYKNDSKKNQKYMNKKNSGIGWLGICLIILLSVIVIYVLFILCRYYRRKKYQNPSFYYKITEEMFEDITPIE